MSRFDYLFESGILTLPTIKTPGPISGTS